MIEDRRVVCAAMRDSVYGVICSPRHWDSIARVQAALSKKEWWGAEQGFVDQTGKFLTRNEAFKVADAAGQIIRRVGGDSKDGGTLYSENLY